MKLYLYRRYMEPTYTIGYMYNCCQRLCSTLEDPVRDLKDLNGDGDYGDPNEGKIYGQTAIPAGAYIIKMQMSPTFQRMMPYLQDVTGFSGIMIHGGIDENSTRGCILVGENKIRGRLVNSRAWSDLINKMLTEAEAKGEENKIYIINDSVKKGK